MAKPTYSELVAAADTLASAHVAADVARTAEAEAVQRRMSAEEHVRAAATAYAQLTNALAKP